MLVCKKIDRVKNENSFLLKLVSNTFLTYIFDFHEIIALQNLLNMFLISSRKFSFRSRDIHISVFPSSPLFLFVSHCFGA